ncbi:tartrate dehydrogenase [Marinisporobacter balticus]|uniref:D-malate dehydrogenase (decarboxylating) n=1 Tax=Marinisporobacter balticus TaxID=2018667 RepID=A0A4R2KLY2_9FIRM|nr:tartrate dehydrogenase [Marinisporobacter balticus]TCO71038.1 tartrate dehydrogenase/decarboxylase/D-malate dehydrogenase [Marinisporobacter balticus]
MKNYKIAVIPGDGIGIEVMNEGIKVLNTLSKLNKDIAFNFDWYDWGCEYYLKHGKMMDEDGLEKLKKYDAILLGAVGFPGVPDHISLRDLLLKIRQGFNQYINLRPIKLLTAQDCPLKNKKVEDIDMVFVRENTEGEYAGVGGFQREGTKDEVALQTSVFTRKTTEKVMEYAFQLAKSRKKLNKVTSVTKSNALNYSMVFWDRIFKEKSNVYTDIKTESFHVDATSMYMLQRPESFDVVVASNLFGDILTDLGATLQGGLGFAAGANINPEREYPSMFEPVHGSAPEIAGKGLANPIAMIWTAKMMLDFLGHEDLGERIMKSIVEALNNREKLTPDLGGSGTTNEVGDRICKIIENIG